ncbi:hypothetical protein AAFN85_19525 [Mucilaginibacter sp. CAU 1740]|uniref:hypothetical protein n=1 Tax=Mucilaginibacter sp. CAU 1740 TaxID=3140365 RepID=UPI00325A71B0
MANHRLRCTKPAADEVNSAVCSGKLVAEFHHANNVRLINAVNCAHPVLPFKPAFT